jgi:hypothetical protein
MGDVQRRDQTMTDCSHFEIRNWREFQHYKDRNPPWIKLHYSLLASEDWVMLADASRVLAVACMLVASQNDGKVPNNPEYLKRVAYLNGENSPDFKPLIRCGFLIPLADASTLQADASKTLASARPETEAYREETETEESREDNAQFDNRGNGHYAFEGQVIKITKAQLDDWSFTFDRINVEGQLQSYDAYLTSELENDPTIRKKWFMRTAQILAKRDQDARNSTSAQKEANGQATTCRS